MESFLSSLPFKPDAYQVEAFEMLSKVEPGRNALVVWPTGCGKTAVAQYVIHLAKQKGKRAIYTTPLKALSTEKRDEWSNNGLKVLRDTSDDRAERDEKAYRDYDILITTNERLDVILRSSRLREDVFRNVGYLVVDEIHLLGSKGRGSTLEFLIMVLRELMPLVTVVGLSATLPNYEEFAAWLQADYTYLPPERRPIPLTHHYNACVPDRMSAKESENVKFYALDNICKTRPAEQFLIFTSSRVRTEKLAARKGGISGSATLEMLLERGCAYHHAGLDEKERAAVETAFKAGKVKYLFATPTLAQGVNLPARNVVMFDLSRWSIFTSSHELLEHYEIQQMAGRAGRRGFDELGRCFYIGTAEEVAHARDSVENPRPMRSQIYECLDDKILALNAADLCNREEEMEAVLGKSFAAHQDGKMVENLVGENLRFLSGNYFVWIEHDGYISPTGYGKLASRIYIKPRTVAETHREVMKLDIAKASSMDLAKAFLKNGEMLSSIRVSDMDANYINAAREGLGCYYDQAVVDVYNPARGDYEKMNLTQNYLKALGLIFAEDIGIDVFGSKQELAVLKKTAGENVSKLHSVLKCKPDYADKMKDSEGKVKLAIAMLEHGITDPEKLKIMLIPGISTVRYGKLKTAGIKSLDDFLNADNAVLSTVLRLKEESVEKMKKHAFMELV